MKQPSWLHYRETPGHGYFSVDSEHFAAMRREHPELLTPTTFYKGSNSFEEDCEICRVVLAFPDAFDDKTVEYAHSWVINYHPEIAAIYFDRPITLEESRILRERADFNAHINDYVGVSASWYSEKFAKVWLVRGGRNPDTFKYASSDEVAIYVPRDEYHAADRFIVKPEDLRNYMRAPLN